MLRRLFHVLFLLALVPALLFAADGKIRGKVTDKDTGEPLVGANVLVEGTSLGAACDINGDYVIIGVRPGVYTVKATYVGYNAVTISNLRVNADITTTQDFKMASSAVQVQAIEIVAERPLIQRNTTNTVRLTTQEDIKNLPVRGTQNLLALQPGVVSQLGNLYVRGGRAGEVAYFIDGANTTNPLSNSEMIGVIQEAIEEFQLQSGGFTAEFGGSNSGIVQTTLRTGTSSYKGSFDLLTDDFAKPGKEFLGTTARGYRNIVATVSGPVPGVPDLKFFLAGQHNYLRFRQNIFLTPFNFDSLRTDESDSYPGRLLPGSVGVKENYMPNDWQMQNQGQGTLLYELRPFKFRLSGSFAVQTNPMNGDWPTGLDRIFNGKRDREEKRTTAFANLRITHVIDASTFYELTANYTSRIYRQSDPDFGSQWWKFTDSTENAAKGYTGFVSRFRGPNPYYIINNFGLNDPNAPNNGFQINKQKGFGFGADLTRQMNKRWETKVGGSFQTFTMRQYIITSIANYNEYLYGVRGTQTRQFTDDQQKRAATSKQAGINNYGYTFDGLETDNEFDAPKKPILASAYWQNKLEFSDLIISFGLRYEYLAPKHKVFPDPNNADFYNQYFATTLDLIDETKLVDAPVYQLLLPRLSFSFPVTDKTVFYAQFGKYAQMPSLNQIYRGIVSQSTNVSPRSRGNAYLAPLGWYIRPERTTQYEMGIRQTLSDNFAFTLSGFYKDTKDQIQDRLFLDAAGTTLYQAYRNDDIGTVKGLELTLELRRTNRLAARFNYTLSDARGTASNSYSTAGAVEQNIGRATNFVNPLDFNQTHRGSLLLDYRYEVGEGGPILSGLGGNLLVTFNSGHPYTKLQPLKELGQSDPWNIGVEASNNDRRFSFPAEPVNASTTPFYLNIDLGLSKMFNAGPVRMEIYAQISNLLNTKQVLNVYAYTGSAEDDGWLTNPLAGQFNAIPNYTAFYRAINQENRYAVLNNTRFASGDLYGSPRSIRVGLRAEL